MPIIIPGVTSRLNPARQIRMQIIHPRIRRRHEHARTRQKIGSRPIMALGRTHNRDIGRKRNVRGNARDDARQIIHRPLLKMHPEHLHLGNLRHLREPIRRHLHRPHLAQHTRLPLAHRLRPQPLHRLQHRSRLPRKTHHSQQRMRRQLLAHRQPQQRRIQLVIRLKRQHRLRERRRLHHPSHPRTRPHQIRIIGHKRNHLRPRRRQHSTKLIRKRPPRLHDVSPRITLRPQMLRNWGRTQRRIDERITQQHRPLTAHQLPQRQRTVAQAIRQPIGHRREWRVGHDDNERSVGCSAWRLRRDRRHRCIRDDQRNCWPGRRRRAFRPGGIRTVLMAPLPVQRGDHEEHDAQHNPNSFLQAHTTVNHTFSFF